MVIEFAVRSSRSVERVQNGESEQRFSLQTSDSEQGSTEGAALIRTLNAHAKFVQSLSPSPLLVHGNDYSNVDKHTRKPVARVGVQRLQILVVCTVFGSLWVPFGR